MIRLPGNNFLRKHVCPPGIIKFFFTIDQEAYVMKNYKIEKTN